LTWLPNLAKDFATDLPLSRFSVGHNTVACRDNLRRETASQWLQFCTGLILPQPGAGNTPNMLDNWLPLRVVPKVDRDGREFGLRRNLKAFDIAFSLKDFYNFDFDFAVWNLDSHDF
jgi:hypothetical protein